MDDGTSAAVEVSTHEERVALTQLELDAVGVGTLLDDTALLRRAKCQNHSGDGVEIEHAVPE